MKVSVPAAGLLAVLCLLPRPVQAEAAAAPAQAPRLDIRFEDVAASAGITFKHGRAVRFHERAANVMPWITAGGAGVAVGDFNNDGLDDIYLTTSEEDAMNALYRNEGGFRFTDVAGKAGVGDVNRYKETGTSAFALWFDADGDGWLDLLLLRFGKTALFRNNRDETFTEVTQSSGLAMHLNSLAAVAFDYDRDGDLDLYVGGYFPPKDLHNLKDSKILFDSWETSRNGGENFLFRNDGALTFTDVTAQAGVQDTGWAMAVGHGDFDNDGWPDLYVANDFGPDTLFRNLGNGTFKNVTREGIGVDTKKGMNAEFGDYNNDGWLDIYVTNMTEPYLHECNMLWKNNRDGTFTDVSMEEQACDTGWGWGAKFFDADNDGWLDIYAANGFISAGEHDYMEELLDFIFREDVDLTDVSLWPPMGNHSMAGYEKNVLLHRTPGGYKQLPEEAGTASIKDGRGVATADFDLDGRVDLVVTNVGTVPNVYRNVSETPNHWLALRLEGRGGKSNRQAIGARVEVRQGINLQMREVAAGNGFEAQSSPKLHFGLGAVARVDLVTVRWPDGEVQELKGLEADKLHVIKQGEKAAGGEARPGSH